MTNFTLVVWERYIQILYICLPFSFNFEFPGCSKHNYFFIFYFTQKSLYLYQECGFTFCTPELQLMWDNIWQLCFFSDSLCWLIRFLLSYSGRFPNIFLWGFCLFVVKSDSAQVHLFLLNHCVICVGLSIHTFIL